MSPSKSPNAGKPSGAVKSSAVKSAAAKSGAAKPDPVRSDPADPAATTSGGSTAPSAAKPAGAGKQAPSAPRASASHAAIDAGLDEVTFLTVAEVAAVMRVSKMTVYRLVHSAELPAVRVGRSFRVPDRAVHDYLQAAFVEAG